MLLPRRTGGAAARAYAADTYLPLRRRAAAAVYATLALSAGASAGVHAAQGPTPAPPPPAAASVEPSQGAPAVPGRPPSREPAPALPGTGRPAVSPAPPQAGSAPGLTPADAAPPGAAAAASAARGGSAGADPIPARGSYRLAGTADKLDLSAVSVDLQELITAIADRAQVPVVIDDVVSRRVTLNITGRDARRVITDIAHAYGLAIADVNGVTMISEGIPRSPSSYLLSDIRSIPTRYVNAANARNLLPVFLQDHVKVNAEQNAVVLSAPADVLEKFQGDIRQFDIPASEIEVELLLVELTDSTIDQLGLLLTWQNNGQGPIIDPGAGTIRYQAITALPDKFAANLRALQQQGKARVRANPRIATVSGRRASIFVGRQRYVATPIDLGDRQGQRNFIDAGVRLGMTPYTGGEGQVLIDVDAEVSTLSAPDPTTNLPEKSTRTASTIVRVGDGKTLVIGGLTQQETRDVRTKIPLLGDLPVFGPLLFQTKDVRTTKTELVLFITPRVLTTTGRRPATEEELLKQRYLDADLSRPVPPLPTPPLPPQTIAPGLSPEAAKP
jgi:type II secretory pathway component GspD/PulD (secretin)